MNRSIRLAVLAGLCLLCQISYAQEPSDEWKIPEAIHIPPTPEAASLGEYGNVPVNLNTGSHNLSIPIYTIQGKESQYPISLSYSGSNGIRVEEIATWAGTGWTLQAAGVITRNTVGMPDLGAFDDGNSNQTSITADYFESYPKIERAASGDWTGDTDYTYDEAYMNDLFFNTDVNDQYYETQPDYFTYNFHGRSGKFTIDHNGSAVAMPDNDYFIDPAIKPGQAIGDFRITAPDGTQYIFRVSDTEKTRYVSEDISKYNIITAWYLSEIISPNQKDRYVFHYDLQPEVEALSSTAQQVSERHYLRGAYFVNVLRNKYVPNIDEACGVYTYNGGSSNQTFQTKQYLSSITLNGVKVVEFIAEAGRLDHVGRKRLKEIKIFDQVYGQPIRSFALNHSYFGSQSNDELVMRLRLDEVRETGYYNNSAGRSKPPYRFYYNTDQENISRHSTSIDHWGYFNQKNNGNNLLPAINNLEDRIDQDYPGADRSANPSAMDVFVLEKVQYPTGGYTEFDYEANTF
ncbi:MAG: hypothetical protein WBH03_11890 [Cyclobacteriaceae bacterium]